MAQTLAADYLPAPDEGARPEGLHVGDIWRAVRARWRLVVGAGR
jgi:hypothetical protein